MSIVKLYEAISTSQAKNAGELSNAETINDMMGFAPVETVARDVMGANDKLFRVGKLI